MSLAKRLDILERLRKYLMGSGPDWEAAKENAYRHNGWFIPAFIDSAVQHVTDFLEPGSLRDWVGRYQWPDQPADPKNVGIVMPGHLPLAGIYDVICVFITGHRQRIRLSPNDEVLMKHLVQTMTSWDAGLADMISFHEMLKSCDAYLVSGKASGPLTHYLGKYPNIIRPTGAMHALLHGTESREELELLADDVFTYFGQGCLNVTHLYVPQGYDFIPLLKAFDKYKHLIDYNKYKNNYDYQLALLILNKEFYMTNGCILMTESASTPSPISRLNYEYYMDKATVFKDERRAVEVKALSGKGYARFGNAGASVICSDINGMDTLKFLLEI